eukprot:SAG31_NODE_11018_length_1074_cov_0.701538_1_plen_357_part_11
MVTARLQVVGVLNSFQLESDHVDDISRHRREAEAALAMQLATHDAEKEKLVEIHRVALRQVDGAANEHLQQELSKRLSAWTTESKINMERLALEHNDVVAELKRAESVMQKEHAAELAEAVVSESRLVADAVKRMELMQTELKTQQAAFHIEKHELTNSHSCKAQQLLGASDALLDLALESQEVLLIDEHKSTIEHLKTEHETALQQLQASAAFTLEKQLNQQQASLTLEHAAELHQTKELLTAEIAGIQEQHAHAISTRDAAATEQIQAMQQEHDEAVKIKKEKRKQKIAEASAQLEQQVDMLRKGLLHQHEDALKLAAEAGEQVQRRHAEELEAIEARATLHISEAAEMHTQSTN